VGRDENVRADTSILAKIRKFRDIRAGQKGPKSDQKGTYINVKSNEKPHYCSGT